MKKFRATAIAIVVACASAQGIAEESTGFYPGAGAGFMHTQDLELPAVPQAEESLAAYGGFRFNSQFGLEGFYADLSPSNLLSEGDNNFYTRSFAGAELNSTGVSSVAGISAVATLVDRGPVKPFARAGLHRYDLAGTGQSSRGGSLLLGAGAAIDLSRGWNARVEWERYTDVGDLDRNIFSASVAYDF